jgi:hypothetical protein
LLSNLEFIEHRKSVIFNFKYSFFCPLDSATWSGPTTRPVLAMPLLKISLSETYGKVWTGNHSSDTLPILNGLLQADASLKLLCFTLECHYKVQVNQEGLKLNCGTSASGVP